MTSIDWWQIIIILFLILLSAFFSSIETAFSSLNRIKIKNLIQNENKRAKTVLKYADDFETLITTILIGNNIVNITAASLATVFFVKHWGQIGVTIATVVITVIVLIFGEIIPKTIAKRVPEMYALMFVPLVSFFSFILRPLSFIFKGLQTLIQKLFKLPTQANITEEELLTFVSEAQQEGGINIKEEELIKSVIDFDDLTVEEILTPRVDVVAVSETDSNAVIQRMFRKSGYSRLPVYEQSLDHIIGIINHKDFYNEVLFDQLPLADIIKLPVFVTEYMKITNLLALLQETKAHMAIVKDEFGGTLGIVTMEDILEEIVGDIWDEHDEVVEQIIQVSETSYRVKGNADLDDFFEVVGINEELDVLTVNGWILDEMGKIPFVGESFTYRNLKVTITGADTKRVLEVLVEVQNISEELTEEVS